MPLNKVPIYKRTRSNFRHGEVSYRKMNPNTEKLVNELSNLKSGSDLPGPYCTCTSRKLTVLKTVLKTITYVSLRESRVKFTWK